MKAISKFLGGCAAKVSQNAENMLVKVGLNQRMDKVSSNVSEQWELQNN